MPFSHATDGAIELDPNDRYVLQERYLELTRTHLPARARRDGDLPIRFDHCFMRIILDHVFEDSWYRHLDRRLRAYKQLTDAQLRTAVDLAERMLQAPAEEVAAMNDASLRWRGKKR